MLLTDNSLKTYLPQKPPTGHNYISSPFVSYADRDEDDPDMEDDVATLSDDCNEITVTDTNEQIEKELNMFSPRRGSNTPHIIAAAEG